MDQIIDRLKENIAEERATKNMTLQEALLDQEDRNRLNRNEPSDAELDAIVEEHKEEIKRNLVKKMEMVEKKEYSFDGRPYFVVNTDHTVQFPDVYYNNKISLPKVALLAHSILHMLTDANMIPDNVELNRVQEELITIAAEAHEAKIPF